MTPLELETLHEIGTDTLHTFVAIVVHAITYTIYLVVAIKAVAVSLRAGRSKISYYTLGVLILLFLMASVLFVLDVVNFITETIDTLVHAGAAPLDVQLKDTRAKIYHRLVVTDLLYSYMCVLGDAIIIWRVKVLWTNTTLKWILWVPWACLGGSIVCAALLTYCGAHSGANITLGIFRDPPFCKNVQTASYCTTLVTTAVATGLIAVKAWQYRQILKPIVNSVAGRVTWVEKMLTLLLESGLIYLAFFFVQVIATIPGISSKSGSSFGFLVYSYSTSVIVGLYPTLIVVLAHSRRAVLDTAATTHSTTWRPSRGISHSTWNNSNTRGSTTRATADNIEVNLTPYMKGESYRSKMTDEMA